MKSPYEKHVKYINLIEVKHNSLIKQQQREQKKHKLKFKKMIHITPCCSA